MSAYLGFEPAAATDAFFISYNTEDAQRIQPIVCQLHQMGIPLWYDYGLEYGEKWSAQIAKRVNDCRAVLLFFSADILKKENSFVRKEYKMAKEFYEKKVFVVLLDNIQKKDIPHSMVDWWIDILSEQNIVAFDVPHDRAFCESLAGAIGAQLPQAVKEEAPFPKVAAPTSAPVQVQVPPTAEKEYPFKKPSHPHAVENWKQVLQTASRDTESQKTEPTHKPAVENWKQVLQAASRDTESKKTEPIHKPAVENWKQVQERQRKLSGDHS